jgi:hypothetical protein
LVTTPAARLVPWLAAIASLVIGLAIARPFADVPVGFDNQATVLYFDRMIAGVQLEQALTTTPKPLLTIVYGLLHGLSGDWRPIIWATILVQAAACGLAALLAMRAAGLAAGAAAGLTLAGMPLLVEDAAFGNAVPWALLGWLVAALLLSGPRPRPVLAGVVLMLAALCRLETLVIVAVGGLALAWARLGPWPFAAPRPVPPPRAWLAVAIPFGALPVMLAHDLVLTGDPFFWVKVSQRYSDAARQTRDVASPFERVIWIVRRYARVWPAVALAAVGLAVLVWRRRWLELVGLTGMGPGIALFLVVLAARGLYAPDRYAIPVDVALSLLAAVGFGWILTMSAQRLPVRAQWRMAVAPAVLMVAAAIVVVAGAGPFDPASTRGIADLRAVNASAARVTPLLRGGQRPGSGVEWIVPTSVRPRVAVDLGVPLTAVGGLSSNWLDPSAGLLEPGQLVFFERHAAGNVGALAVLDRGQEVRVGPLRLQPILADGDAGVFVYEVVAD